ncbi:phosphate ABC transporter substrate-binding protein [Mycobacterium tuberculosis]|nr:phosphate ABC transporter substrate-binding protein [Mycobacterium tuberculosis]
MKFARSGAAVSLLAAGTLVLTACGGGTNSSSSGAGGTSGSVHCGGKKELHSSGSTAQENAMEQFVYASCDRARATRWTTTPTGPVPG